MVKFASVALAAAFGVAGVAHSVAAKADPHLRVGISLPGVAIVAPFGYAPGYYAYAPPFYPAPYYPGYGRYWHREYDRDRYEHSHRHWDHDGDRRWDRR